MDSAQIARPWRFTKPALYARLGLLITWLLGFLPILLHESRAAKIGHYSVSYLFLMLIYAMTILITALRVNSSSSPQWITYLRSTVSLLLAFVIGLLCILPSPVVFPLFALGFAYLFFEFILWLIELERIAEFVLFSGLCGLIFGIGEITLRLNPMWVGGGGGGNPGLARLYRNLYHYNRFGLRDVEFNWGKGDGVFRILGLGDSMTFGQGVPLDSIFLKVMQSGLSERWQQPVEVINASQRGWNTEDERDFLLEHGFNLQPDLVLLGFYINDIVPSFTTQWEDTSADHNWFFDLAYAVNSQLRRSYALFFLDYRLAILKQRFHLHPSFVDEIRAKYDLASADWLRFKSAFEQIADACQKRDIPLVVVIIPHLGAFQPYPFAEEQQQVIALAKASGVDAIDLTPVLAQLPVKHYFDLWVNKVDAHPGIRAHRVMGTALAAYFDLRKISVPSRQINFSKNY